MEGPTEAEARAYLVDNSIEVSDDPRGVVEIATLHMLTGSSAMKGTDPKSPVVDVIPVTEGAEPVPDSSLPEIGSTIYRSRRTGW